MNTDLQYKPQSSNSPQTIQHSNRRSQNQADPLRALAFRRLRVAFLVLMVPSIVTTDKAHAQVIDVCTGLSVNLPVLQPVTAISSGILAGLLAPVTSVLNGVIGDINVKITDPLSGRNIG